ncbi:MAG: glycosyltransferase family 2 protein [Capsulimonadaceae bacterium]|nr:glycosyltransferase family 2 protein [Capsulimonadaceae bacterium]
MTDSSQELPSVSVVVPVFNSELSLPILVERLTKTLAQCAGAYEIILVNDDSRDRAWSVVCDLSAANDAVQGISLTRNYGQHNALLCGVRAARHEIIVTIDDDLQHPPEEIPSLLARLSEGYDVVYGAPASEQHGLLRDLASQFVKLALQASTGYEVARSVSAFRAFRTYLRDGFAQYRSPNVSIDVLLTWSTTRFATVKVRHEKREIGPSNYTLRKLLVHAVNMITSFSTLPLQIASVVGFAFTLFGFGILAWVVGRWILFGTTVPGFPFLASIIAIFSGAQLFALGIIGEYLARMHFRTMDRPAYTIRTVTKADEPNGDVQ